MFYSIQIDAKRTTSEFGDNEKKKDKRNVLG